jgi:hypothetical protein
MFLLMFPRKTKVIRLFAILSAIYNVYAVVIKKEKASLEEIE